jgi:hypothetical protein
MDQGGVGVNCRKGDLCVIVRADGENVRYIGQFLTVISPYCLRNVWFWTYEGPTRFFFSDGQPLHIDDAALQPIRPPKRGQKTSNPKEIETI